MLVLAAAAAVVLVAFGIGAIVVLGQGGKPEAEAGSIGERPTAVDTTLPYEPVPEGPVDGDTTTEETTPTEATVAPVEETEEAALAELEELAAQGLTQVSFRGQYAAQIASKYPGIHDKLQTTAAGSHTFTAADIRDEHRQLASAHSSPEHPVILLRSTDYGKRQQVNGRHLWVTFAIGDFPDRQSVLDWCDNQFAELTADERANQCAVRKLNPGR
ncbi:hypothetical protein [Paractinoplanes brasiliensis]|uniref:Uncharacterized protein n=1 Tax=Paractinoplanes brasiliensis TaxID=52695 RepID=A0A4R6JZ43_9ACTN|nr:hypothetical protein [Actinoplanes brasiliensis]TDO42144.1 hypothetical protein C8E87_5908 [Actinoplanes brasiliensis]GID31991.1 hypothetical protein Abr02nite_69740 [Actinoplanes brasiliensis]